MSRQTLPIDRSIIHQIGQTLWHAGCAVRSHEPMSAHTTFRIGGEALWFVTPIDEDSLIETIRMLRSQDIPYKIIGKASNLLITDQPLSCAVIHTSALSDLHWHKETGRAIVEAGCGCDLTHLAWSLCKQRFSGMEFACGIPGSLGGGVWMNAGAFGSDLGSSILSIRYYDPIADQIFTADHAGAAFSYRKSLFQEHPQWVILSVTLELEIDRDGSALQKAILYRNQRWEKQPLEYPSAGSIFKKPFEDFHVGKVLEELGLKGERVGDAQVSTKHAGFIINRGHARCNDVLSLICRIQKIVLEKTGTFLLTEVQIWEESEAG